MNRRQAKCVLAGAGLLFAGGVAYLATRSAGPVQLPAFTESRNPGPLMEHLVTREELGLIPASVPHRYPNRVAPGISLVVSQGFAPLYRLSDPQIAALPAEGPW